MLKNIKKKVAYLLTVFMLGTVLPMRILAAGDGPNLDALRASTVKKEGKIIGEIVEKREKNIKHFIKDDLSYEAAVYDYPVHYLKNNKWEDIDNSLVEKTNEENKPIVENKENDFKVRFAKKADAGKLVDFNKDKYQLEWGIEEANKVDLSVKASKPEENLSENDKKKFLQNIVSIVEYNNIKDQIDLQYKLMGDVLKENIIINSKIDSPKITFNLKVKNLIPKLQEDNSIAFYDDKNTSEAVFTMNAPFMYDASGEESSKINLDLKEEKNQYTLTITPDNEWITSENRKFPVTIDPPITTSLGVKNIHDSHVSSNYSGSNFYQSYTLRTGYGSPSGVNRSYIAFDLPTLTSADLVTDAVLTMYKVGSYTTPTQVNVHKVNGSWSSSTITWNNAPSFDSKVTDYQMLTSQGQYNWHITPIVKGWYTTGNNTGLMLKNQNESGNYTEFYSSDTSSAYTNCRPMASIYYINNSGLESYWTYHSATAGRAGMGYVNDYNGNLIFTHDDLEMNGNRMPISIKHVFNSNDRDQYKGYGSGWRLNLSQRVEIAYGSTFSDGIQRYIYTDEDGTKHYFKADASGTSTDESGVDLTLQVKSDGGYLIKDKDGNSLDFVPGGYLYKLIDKNGNTATLSYDGVKLNYVTDGAGRVITLEVVDSGTPEGALVGIIDPSGRRTSFAYEGSDLTTIIYPDNKTTTFNYDANHNLLSATNYDGYKISYEYYTASPYKVSKVKESNTNGTLGGELSLDYGYNRTTFTDVKGRKETYLFNDSGNTVSVKDDKGNAEYYKYLDSNKSKLELSSKLQGTVTNYLKNHSIEVSSGYWNLDYWTGSIGSGSFTTEDYYMGSNSLKVTKANNIERQFYNQSLTLEKGKTYTFSAYVKTSAISNTSNRGAGLFVNYQDGSGNWYTIESKLINGTNSWQRVEVKFTLPSDAVSNYVYARAGIMEESGTAYFDCLQVEDGSIANRYNLIENSSLGYGDTIPDFWAAAGDTDSSDTSVSVDGRTAFKFNGVATGSKLLYQVVNVSGKKGDALVLSGWGKGDSVPLTQDSGRYFTLDIGLRRADGTAQWEVAQFNEDSGEWQYVANKVIADSDYSYIEYYILYYNNANTAYFDDLQLYKEEFGTSYQYDSKGNVVSTVDLAKQKSSFEYNTNNDLIKATDPKGSSFNYEYTTDGKRNLTKATSAENVVYSFTYDSYGNPKTSKVGDGITFINSTAEYTDSGNYIKSVTDSYGNTVSYSYNETKGTLDSATDANSKVTSYGYDNMDRLTSASKTVNGISIINCYAYLNDRISSITHNGFSYNFGYDSLGNNTTVAVGSQNLITNTYEARTSKLLKSTYGNGQYVSSDYDNLNRVTAKSFNGSLRYKYEYDASGNLGLHEDLVNGVSYRYFYDTADRLVKVNGSDGNSLSYDYDANNNASKISDKVNGTTYDTSYGYDKDNKPTSIIYTRAASNNIGLTYDILGRLKSKSVNIGGAPAPQFVTNYTYLAGINGATTNKVSSISNAGSSISYTYDKNGNIKTITQGGKLITYTYDELNEVTREDNGVLNKTIVYSYDAGGNITSKKEYAYTTGTVGALVRAYNYGYGDTNWKDKLTSYDGKAITYDAIGNPLTYDGYTFTWEEGRQLKAISGNSKTISYKYNDSGIRTEKNFNGTVTKYHLVGNKVTFETNGTDNIYYTYDSSDNLVSMNLNGVEYYYIRNAQGDIIGLFDRTGAQVVSYTYDTWGKLISTTGTLASTVGAKNPYRYRGYRYDSETGLYYLNSRYYNPEWGRFINADAIAAVTGELLSSNMFAYCINNPVNMNDDTGFRPAFDSEEQENDYYDWLYQQRAVSYYNSSTVIQTSSTSSIGSNITYSKTRDSKPLSDDWLQGKSVDDLDDMYRQEKDPIKKQKIKTQQKYLGGRNKQKRANKIEVGFGARIVLGIGGTLLIGATIAEDIITVGAGVADDGLTISSGLGMVVKAFAN